MNDRLIPDNAFINSEVARGLFSANPSFRALVYYVQAMKDVIGNDPAAHAFADAVCRRQTELMCNALEVDPIVHTVMAADYVSVFSEISHAAESEKS